MKHLVFLSIGLLVIGSTCSVKEELKSLQQLRSECDNLNVELGALGAKKWTKVIDDKVKECETHGFGDFDKRKNTKPVDTSEYFKGIE